MGQAKNRGTFEERKALAVARKAEQQPIIRQMPAAKQSSLSLQRTHRSLRRNSLLAAVAAGLLIGGQSNGR